MKKLTIMFLLLLVVLFSGCAMKDEMDPQDDGIVYDPSMSEYMFYNWNTMTFSNTSQYDIMYKTENPVKDFLILREGVDDLMISEPQTEGYVVTLDILNTYAISSGNELSESLTYTSDELVSKTKAYNIEVNAMDIITYNALKVEIEDIKDNLNGRSSYLTKEEYIEARIERTLTQDEIIALEYLQSKFMELQETTAPFVIADNDFNDLLNHLATHLDYTPTEEQRSTLEIAFNIIKSLHDD